MSVKAQQEASMRNANMKGESLPRKIPWNFMPKHKHVHSRTIVLSDLDSATFVKSDFCHILYVYSRYCRFS